MTSVVVFSIQTVVGSGYYGIKSQLFLIPYQSRKLIVYPFVLGCLWMQQDALRFLNLLLDSTLCSKSLEHLVFNGYYCIETLYQV